MDTIDRRPVPGLAEPVATVTLGTVKWGRNQDVKYPAFTLPDDATLHRLLDVCAARGVNMLDTAPAYGISEERIGHILAAREDGRSFLVSTKAGEEFEDGRSRFDFSAAALTASVERSLERLGRDRLDLVYIHAGQNDLAVLRETDAAETLQKLRAAGKLASIGFSATSVEAAMAAADAVDALMIPYNVTFRAYEDAISAAGRKGKAVFIKRAMNSGNFAPASGGVESLLRPLRAMDAITSILVGTISPAHLEENIDAWLAASRAGQPAA